MDSIYHLYVGQNIFPKRTLKGKLRLKNKGFFRGRILGDVRHLVRRIFGEDGRSAACNIIHSGSVASRVRT